MRCRGYKIFILLRLLKYYAQLLPYRNNLTVEYKLLLEQLYIWILLETILHVRA